MNTPERLEEIADKLRDAGYKVKPAPAYYEEMAARLRAAGWDVTAPGSDPAGDKADRDAQLRADAEQRNAPSGAFTPNGTGDPDANATSTPRTPAKTTSAKAGTSASSDPKS